MNKLVKVVYMACCGLGLVYPSIAVSDAKTGLFSDHAPLLIELEANLGRLCWKSKKRSCEDSASPAKLTHTSSDGVKHTFNVHIETRGRWRKKQQPCSLPLLFIDFSHSDTDGTLFEGQGSLPLTTPCRKGSRNWQQYLLREYLGYRIYNLLTDKSIRVRLAQMTYRNPSRSGAPTFLYVFFSEHFLSVAKRNDAELKFLPSFNTMDADANELAILDLFQFMIGNTDWSVVSPHNIVFLYAKAVSPIPLPYDFDFSGLANAKYAEPPKKLRLANVRQRLFRGFCREGINWDSVFERFQAAREAVFQILEDLPGMTNRSRNFAGQFLDSFYTILAAPEQRRSLITDACRQ